MLSLAQLVVCVLHKLISHESFPTNQWGFDTRTETSVGHIVDSILGLNEQMFQLVLGDVGLGRWIEAADDGGGFKIVCFGPWEKVVWGSTVGSANLQESAEGSENLRITLIVGQEFCDAFS